MNWFLYGYKTYDPQLEGYGNPSQWKRAFRQRMTPDQARSILDEDDPFIILGIHVPHPTKRELKKAYYAMAMKHHPDRNPNDVQNCTEKMKKINAAYDYLLFIFGY